jgi:hypothetical protein
MTIEVLVRKSLPSCVTAGPFFGVQEVLRRIRDATLTELDGSEGVQMPEEVT